MKLVAVIFDLDGVIVSTDEFHYLAWKQLAEEEALFFDYQMNQRLLGVSRMESLAIILENSSKEYSFTEKEALAQRKNQYYKRLIERLSPRDILPGVNAFLAKLRKQGMKMAIGSSSKNCPLILEKIGLADAFPVVVDGNQITNSKPDPEVFLTAAARLAIAPENCLVIEDAKAGVTAALAGNMKVLGVGAAATDERATWRAADLTEVDLQSIIF